MSDQAKSPEASVEPPTTAERDEAQTTQIVRKQPKPLSLRDPGQLARAFAESGYWKHVTKPAQAVVIMAAGEELGLTPLASMQGITMIEGNIGYRGNLIAMLLRQHERYDYRVLDRTNESCTLQFLVDGEPIPDDADEGRVTFSVEDAERMELVKPRSNWVKTPRAMCFNRALTEGARVHFPDLTAGTPVYSTEEIEEIIDVTPIEQPTAEVVTPDLPNDTVEFLAQGLELSGLIAREVVAERGLDDLNIELGSLGIEAFVPDVEIADQLCKLTEEEAAKLGVRLDELTAPADAEAGEAGNNGE